MPKHQTSLPWFINVFEALGNVTADTIAGYIVYISIAYTVLYSYLGTKLDDGQTTSFRVQCHNKQHNKIITVNVGDRKLINASIIGRLLSTSYNCCVSAVHPLYEAKEMFAVLHRKRFWYI